MDVSMCNACKLFNKDLKYCAFSMYIGDVCPNFTPNQVMNRLNDFNEAMERFNQKILRCINEMEAEQAKKKPCKIPKCYFCGGDCYSDTTITVNCGNLNQSELFKAYVCSECAESVKSALTLLRTVTPKKEGGDSNV